MNRTVLSVVVAALTLGSALADTYVPGTRVSYKVQKAGGKNTSMLFFNADSDKSGKTYMAFKCQGQGRVTISLYSKDILATSETDVSLIVKDGGTINKNDGYIRKDRQTGRLSVWEVSTREVTKGLGEALLNASGPVTVTVMREGGSLNPVSYRFNTKGIDEGMKAINDCE